MLELALYTGLWMIVGEYFQRTNKVPVKFQKIEDAKERKKKTTYYNSYFPALLHGPTSSLYSMFLLILFGIKYTQPFNWMQTIPVKFSTSFFIYDTIFGIVRKYNDWMNSVHHLVIVVVFIWSLSLDNYSSECVIAIFQGEITNPFIALHDVLDANGFSSAITMPFGISFLLLFIGIRTTFSVHTLAKIQLSSADIFFKSTLSFMWTLSMFWVWMMINKAAKQLSEVTTPSNT